MSLTREIQEKFIQENFNKPVVYISNIGRLIGYIETKSGFSNVIYFGFGHKESFVYIDAGLKLTFLEKDNILFEETNKLLSLNGNPELSNIFFEDRKEDILFNTAGNEYLKNHATSLLNKLVSVNNDILRVVGYCESEDQYSCTYLCFNIKNKKEYIEDYFSIKEAELSDNLRAHLERKIKKTDKIIVEIEAEDETFEFDEFYKFLDND